MSKAIRIDSGIYETKANAEHMARLDGGYANRVEHVASERGDYYEDGWVVLHDHYEAERGDTVISFSDKGLIWEGNRDQESDRCV